ncbi:MAG TPA: cytochrome c [Miltoncostaea sp.]|nr:cytochrome c [Miltoncostaea sp.]
MIRTSESESGGELVRSRLMVALTVVVLVIAALGVAGCVDSSEEAAQTPSGSPTVVNSAKQTDSSGKTITAPTSTPAAGGGGTETGGGASTAGGGAAAAGDATAGKQVFAANCTGCHLSDGTADGGVGPKLAGLGLDATTIKNQVINGGGPMPGGLVSGTDLDNVVAYVVSLQ